MNLLKSITNFKKQLSLIASEKYCIYCNGPFYPHQINKPLLSNDLDELVAKKANLYYDLDYFEQLKNLFALFINSNLCPTCANNFKIKTENFCSLCGINFSSAYLNTSICGNCSKEYPPWYSFYFVNSYENMLKELIIRAKFNSSNVALKFLGSLLAYFWIFRESLEPNFHEYKEYVLIPIPIHRKRLLERGYNQCFELAKYFMIEISQIQNKLAFKIPSIKLDITTLTRIKYKPPQSALNAKNRLKNIKNVFISNQIDAENIILLDDVATTNSTIKEATNCLKSANAKNIKVLVIAKG